MTTRMVAFCGLLCTECPAYVATQANDEDALARVAKKWGEEYHIPGVTVDSIRCDGCVSVGGQKCGHCAQCEISSCGLARRVANCGHCTDYPCEKLERFLRTVPAARPVLEGERFSRKTRREQGGF